MVEAAGVEPEKHHSPIMGYSRRFLAYKHGFALVGFAVLFRDG
jgi:hypothetical protein